MRCALVLALSLLAGCGSFDGVRPFGGGAGTTRTFDAPIARVKPAFVSTLAQMGMTISSIETRGKREVLKARKGSSRVELEMERLGASSTRVRVDAGDGASAGRIIRQAEKLLASG
jgi:hypothetical protein